LLLFSLSDKQTQKLENVCACLLSPFFCFWHGRDSRLFFFFFSFRLELGSMDAMETGAMSLEDLAINISEWLGRLFSLAQPRFDHPSLPLCQASISTRCKRKWTLCLPPGLSCKTKL
jgi:hypothetical protein